MKPAVLQLTALATDLVVLALDMVVTVRTGVGVDCIPARGAILQPYKVRMKPLTADRQVCRVGTSKSPSGFLLQACRLRRLQEPYMSADWHIDLSHQMQQSGSYLVLLIHMIEDLSIQDQVQML